MSARRLLGYVVKLPDGTRSPHTSEPLPATEALRAALFEVPTGTYLVPVFATPKRQTLTDIPPEVFAYSDNEGGVCLTWPLANAERQRATEEAKGTYKCGPIVRYVPEPKPAPAEGAAEGLFGWLDTTDGSWVHVGPMPRAEAESCPNLRNRGRKLVRVLDDGAHEAAVEAARREERERVEADVLTFLADAYKANVFKGANETTKEVNRALQAVSEWIRARPAREKTARDMAAHEAAKGQAK